MEEVQEKQEQVRANGIKPQGNKLLIPLLLAVAVIVAGGAFILGKSWKGTAPQATPAPTVAGVVAPEGEVVATATPEVGATVAPTPVATTSPSPTTAPTVTPTPTPTGTFNLKLNPNLFKVMTIFQITKVELTVDDDSKVSFMCLSKATFNFTGKITSNAAGTATYRWERSDGVFSSAASLTFAAAETKTMTTSWQVPCGTYWMKLHITAPNDISSDQVSFKLSSF